MKHIAKSSLNFSRIERWEFALSPTDEAKSNGLEAGELSFQLLEIC